MGAIAAIVHKEKQTAANAVLTMLKTLSHRGKVAYGIASAKTQTLSNSIERLDSRNIQANIALGYVFSRILPEDTPKS